MKKKKQVCINVCGNLVENYKNRRETKVKKK